MKTLILVHGAFADQNVWGTVKPQLEAKGYRVITPDLPGHGTDQTPVADISLAAYVSAVGNIVNEQPDQVTLVGHSLAGMVISGGAEIYPEKLERLVYVAAYLPQSGQSLQELAQTDKESLVGANMQFAPDYSTVTIKKDMVAEAICADVPATIQEMIVNNQKPEPLKPFADKLELTATNFGRVPKYYLETTQDKAVSNTLQKAMVKDNGQIKQMLTMNTSHLPFVAQPEQFVTQLLSLF